MTPSTSRAPWYTFISSGAGADTINVGAAGSVQNINAYLSIDNPSASDTININDSADTAARTVTMSSYTPTGDTKFISLTGLAPAEIDYEASDTQYANITSGSGGDTFNVYDTAWANSGNTVLRNGSSSFNTINVYGTTGGLYVDGGSGGQSVNVGNSGSALGNGSGSMQNINRFVYPYNSGSNGYTYLHLDDSGDAAGRTVSMYDGSIYGLAPGNIYWLDNSSGSYYGGVDYLAV